jgi:hypothetical protein
VIGIAEPTDVAPAGHESLLGGIARALGVAEDQESDRVELVDPEAPQL